MRNQYLLAPTDRGFEIIHVASNYKIGYADVRGAKYCVRDDDGDEIAVVSSINEAIPVLQNSYEKNPRQWQRCSATLYAKTSRCGWLEVEQDQSGHWVANRNGASPLLRNGNPGLFDTAKEARCAAEAHLRDGFPDAKANQDGLSWLPDEVFDVWSDPYG